MEQSWQTCLQCARTLAAVPWHVLLGAVLATLIGIVVFVYVIVSTVAPKPRPSFPEETKYRSLARDGSVTEPQQLPSWQEEEEKKKKKKDEKVVLDGTAEVFMSVVVPAYNEEDRLMGMLEEAVDYLEHEYGTVGSQEREDGKQLRSRKVNGQAKTNGRENGNAGLPGDNIDTTTTTRGWEILLVSDGSTDKTEEVAFQFAREHQLSRHPRRHSGPWTSSTQEEGVSIPPGTIRVVTLSQNRGKGGAVTHGMRHVRGRYVVFADADGASKFTDLGKLVTACRGIEDSRGRGVAVGSRAHMVGSEAVVKRSKLRNFLMHSFHMILWLLTPPKTATIKDTQCGFKLFSRAALPDIIPYMHSEGWIFDVEMLMLAEFAGIPVAEVPVGWHEVSGSKLNVIRDSIGMAWGLAILRVAWSLGVYRRRV
ncbi:hypothetical protein ASPZODRAFT_62869 [Penicilliopsis zonata CBS 506.65]|uniref:dolichyl-phosphate beta-glucosyltransferase n=1 Tax=Penicilliopsis zonata CBS 506.65 TaxID=1073090 RepID=A0A1L9SM19_9EURO|nr:hypothetical protein ASPZODRAFT_62869 [Penicilliopsis zonata CBS 506.65]OJJ48289.1 hypothetical protein ASPZODRAFT_62869 [Penicilliopsis zonata CBS 506.65]